MPIAPRRGVRALAHLPGVIRVAALAVVLDGGAGLPGFTPSPLLRPATAAALFAGRPSPASGLPSTGPDPAIEDSDRFVMLDRSARVSVTCTDLQQRLLPDGRLEVAVSMKNRARRRIPIQINCVFKDVQGFSTGDETPFRDLILAGESTGLITFTAANNLARKYTIRVRLARPSTEPTLPPILPKLSHSRDDPIPPVTPECGPPCRVKTVSVWRPMNCSHQATWHKRCTRTTAFLFCPSPWR